MRKTEHAEVLILHILSHLANCLDSLFAYLRCTTVFQLHYSYTHKVYPHAVTGFKRKKDCNSLLFQIRVYLSFQADLCAISWIINNCLPWNQHCGLLKPGSASSTLAHSRSIGEGIWPLTSYYVSFGFNIPVKGQLVFIQKSVKGFACQCVLFYFNLNLLVKVSVFAMLCSFPVMARILKS